MLADRAAGQIRLEDSLNFVVVRPRPKILAIPCHASRAAGVGMNRLQQLALPVDQPADFCGICGLRQIVELPLTSRNLLLCDPQSFRGCRKRIWISPGGYTKQRSRFGLAMWNVRTIG